MDTLCAIAGWTRRDLADRLGVGTSVLDYYVRDRAPQWLAHALMGIAVVELRLSPERARELVAVVASATPADSNAG